MNWKRLEEPGADKLDLTGEGRDSRYVVRRAKIMRCTMYVVRFGGKIVARECTRKQAVEAAEVHNSRRD